MEATEDRLTRATGSIWHKDDLTAAMRRGVMFVVHPRAAVGYRMLARQYRLAFAVFTDEERGLAMIQDLRKPAAFQDTTRPFVADVPTRSRLAVILRRASWFESAHDGGMSRFTMY